MMPLGQGGALSLFQAGQGGPLPPAPELGQNPLSSMQRCLQREGPEVGSAAGLPRDGFLVSLLASGGEKLRGGGGGIRDPSKQASGAGPCSRNEAKLRTRRDAI